MTRVANIDNPGPRQESFPFQRPQTMEPPPTRRRNRRGRIRAFLRKVFVIVVLVAIQLLGYAWYQGYTTAWIERAWDSFIASSLEAGYGLEKIKAEGQVRTADEAIIEALAIAPGDPLFDMDMRDLRARVEALPWVREAVVTRELPATIKVRVRERTPFARWQIAGDVVLVDETAAVITGAKTTEFSSLPFIVGPDAPQKAPALFALIASEPVLAGRVVAAIRVGDRRWDLEFDNGMRLRLPEPAEGYGEAEAWAAFIEMNKTQAVMDMDVAIFDLRLSDRVVMRLTPEGQKAFDNKDPGT